jgi:hypothetical protein
MSIHENPAFTGNLASQTEGTKVEPPATFCGHTLGVSVSTAATIATAAATAIALGAQQAIIFATGAMRFTLDNATTPTASVWLACRGMKPAFTHIRGGTTNRPHVPAPLAALLASANVTAPPAGQTLRLADLDDKLSGESIARRLEIKCALRGAAMLA